MFVIYPLLCAGYWLGQAAPDSACASFLYQPAYCIDHELRVPAGAYEPQPGDIMLHMDDNRFWAITHNLAGAFRPHGSGIVVAKPDGSLGILEAGPNDCMHIRIVDVVSHLQDYEDQGLVWIRQRRTPLTPEQSACLTEFALRQDGKIFALQRLGVQLTPFRTRGPLRTYVVGKPHGDRLTYFCSELVTEACVAGHLIDAETARPSATYPHDLFFEHSLNPYLRRHFSLAADWDPPALWTGHPVSTVSPR